MDGEEPPLAGSTSAAEVGSRVSPWAVSLWPRLVARLEQLLPAFTLKHPSAWGEAKESGLEWRGCGRGWLELWEEKFNSRGE